MTNYSDDSERLFRNVALARINSIQSERLFLSALYRSLREQCDSVQERISAIDRQIEAEKKSVQ